jgi:hypothetical protein
MSSTAARANNPARSASARRGSLGCVLALLALALVPPGMPARAAAPEAPHWLLMVRTLNTDPARTQEFNDWYNNIDLPDVLAVPGFRRALRAQAMGACADSAAPCDAGERYVALYDIESPAIDKTIIDMLMATWKMLRSGRDTSLLQVEERVYYRRLAADAAPEPASVADGQHFLLLERFDTQPQLTAAQLQRLVGRQVQALGALGADVRTSRYELYRVLMFEPRTAPRYLTAFRFRVTAPAAAQEARDALRVLAQQQRSQGYLQAADPLLYRELIEAAAGSAH